MKAVGLHEGGICIGIHSENGKYCAGGIDKNKDQFRGNWSNIVEISKISSSVYDQNISYF